jgi:hypothetical protein
MSEDRPAPSRLRRRATAAAPFAVFAVAVAVLMGPALTGATVQLPHDIHLDTLPWRATLADAPAQNPELRDLIDQYYPVQHHLYEQIRAGEDATWIRDVGFGQIGIEFVGWGALSPFSLPGLVLPFDLAWSWGQALRLYAAMAGAYLLVRSLGAGRAGATVAGLSFGLSGFVTAWLGWPQSHVAAVMPWLWWAVRRAVVGVAPPWWAGPAVAVTTAGLWLGGFPAVSLYALLGAAVVGLHGLVGAREHGGGPLLSRAVVLGGGVVVGTLLVAFTLLPSTQWLDAMDLGARRGALSASISPAYLWTFLAPHVFGDVVTTNRWLATYSYVESIGYAGVVTAALAIPAWIIRGRARGVWLFTGIGLVAGAFAYGVPPVVAALGALPGMSVNPPPRAVALVGLCIAVVGGLGADALLGRLRGEGRVDLRALAVVGAVLTGVVAFVAGTGVIADLTAQVPDRVSTPERITEAYAAAEEAVLRALALLGAAIAVVAVVALLHRTGRSPEHGDPRRGLPSRPQIATGLGAVGLVAVVATDLLLFSAGWNLQAPRDELFPSGPGIAELRADSEGFRTAGTHTAGYANANLEYGISDLRVRGFLTTRQREVLRAAGARFPSPTRWDLDLAEVERWEPWLSAAGVRTVLAPAGSDRPPEGWSVTTRGPVRLLRNPDARPLVSALPSAQVVPFGQAAAALAEAGPDAVGETAFVEAGGPIPLPDGERADVLGWAAEGGRLTAVVDSDDGALLVVLDAAVPGWQATIGGERAPMVTVDHLYLGVVVPAGEQTVALRYVAPGAVAGRWLSGLGVVLLLASGWGGRRRRRLGVPV